MIDKIRNSKINIYLPFVFMGVVMFVFYFTATVKFGDDLYLMTTNPLQHGLVAMNTDVYHNWSSRMFIYPTMVALSLAPIWLWRILDLAVWLMLSVTLSKLFEKKGSSNWFIVALMMLYPYWHMATAGWIATTTNYSWPLAFGMFALLTLKRVWEGTSLPVYRWILFVAAMLYASDAEQKLMILIIVFAILAIKQVYENAKTPLQYKITLFAGLGFLAARLVFTLTAPGNHVRRLTGHYTVPDFADYSLLQQALLSFELTAMHYTQFTIVLFPVFSLMLLIIVWKLHSDILKRLFAIVPLAISTALSITTAVNALQFARDNMAQYEGLFLDAFILMTILDLKGNNLLFVLFFASLLYALYLSCKNKSNRFYCIGIMLLGFLSQFVVGLTPSLYGSALRTFIYASFSVIICAIYLYQAEAKLFTGKLIKILLATACFINFSITLIIGIVRALI
jgi:hypothetical protein